MELSKHAKIRIKERCGLPKRAMSKNAIKALQDGIRHSETTGKLKKYIDWLFLSHRSGGKIRIYNNYVYIFTIGDILITVLPLPDSYKNSASKVLRKRETT